MSNFNEEQKITLNIDSYNICGDEFKGIINHLIINLKIIQNINKSDKISLIDNNIIINDGNSIFQGIYRWYSNSNRLQTIDDLTFIIDKFNNIINLLSNKKNELDKLKNITNSHENKKKIINNYINELYKEIPNTILGIENLKITYKDDIEIINKLDIIKKGLLTRSSH